MAVRVAARMVAFIPEQSPPLVRIASRFTVSPYSACGFVPHIPIPNQNAIFWFETGITLRPERFPAMFSGGNRKSASIAASQGSD